MTKLSAISYNRKIVPLSVPVKLVTGQLDNIFRGKSLLDIFPTKEINIGNLRKLKIKSAPFCLVLVKRILFCATVGLVP